MMQLASFCFVLLKVAAFCLAILTGTMGLGFLTSRLSPASPASFLRAEEPHLPQRFALPLRQHGGAAEPKAPAAGAHGAAAAVAGRRIAGGTVRGLGVSGRPFCVPNAGSHTACYQ